MHGLKHRYAHFTLRLALLDLARMCLGLRRSCDWDGLAEDLETWARFARMRATEKRMDELEASLKTPALAAPAEVRREPPQLRLVFARGDAACDDVTDVGMFAAERDMRGGYLP